MGKSSGGYRKNKLKEVYKFRATTSYVMRGVKLFEDYDFIPFNKYDQGDDQLPSPKNILYLSDSWYGSVKIADQI